MPDNLGVPVTKPTNRSVLYGSAPFTPLDVPGCFWWTDCGVLEGVTGTPVTAMVNKADPAHYFVAPPGDTAPTIVSGRKNGLPVLRFSDAAISRLIAPIMTTRTPLLIEEITMFAVASFSNSQAGDSTLMGVNDVTGADNLWFLRQFSSNNLLFRHYNSAGSNASCVFVLPDENFHILTGITHAFSETGLGASFQTLWLDGVLKGSSSNGINGTGRVINYLNISGRDGAGVSLFAGDFAEGIAYLGTPSLPDQRSILQYLSKRWNIPLAGLP